MSRTEAQKKAIKKYESKMAENDVVWTKVRVPKKRINDIRAEATKMRLNPEND